MSNYVIYSLIKDDVVRFRSTPNEIVVYGDISEAREDAYGLGPGFFVHKVEDALPHHQREINKQLKQP